MSKTYISIVSVILLVVVFVLGAWIGAFYQLQGASKNATQTVSPIEKELSSKVISSINAYGQVTKIDGSNITLSPVGDSLASDGLTVSINSNAKIYSLTIPTNGAANNKTSLTPTAASFSDIKTGNYLNINITLNTSSANQLQGQMVYIYNYTK